MNKHFFNISIIILLIFLAWNKILSRVFLGEAYTYFFIGLRDSTSFYRDQLGMMGSPHNLFRYNVGASLFFDLLKPIFKDNFLLYQAVELLSIVAICILFYFFVYEFTSRKEISLLAAIFFGVNFAHLEMLGDGFYQHFIERVFFVILLFPSFLLLFKYFKTQRKVYYITALVFCFLSIFLAYYNMFFVIFLAAYLLALLAININSLIVHTTPHHTTPIV